MPYEPYPYPDVAISAERLNHIEKGLTEVDGGSAEPVAWGDVTGKPSTFPPATHSHTIADIADLQDALDALQAQINALGA